MLLLDVGQLLCGSVSDQWGATFLEKTVMITKSRMAVFNNDKTYVTRRSSLEWDVSVAME